MNYSVLEMERIGPVALVMLNRPDKANAMGPEFWPELLEVFETISDDREVRAVVLGARGKNFSGGLDLAASIELIPRGGDGPDLELATCHDFIRSIQKSFIAVARCDKPVIAAVQGACVGAGLDLIAACDIRLASTCAAFSLREARIGLVADLGSLQLLPRIIGEGNLRELAYTAKNIDAERAREIGLVNAVYDGPPACLDAAMDMANEIAGMAPLAVRGAKQTIDYSRGKSLEEGLDYAAARNTQLIRSADVKEAFLSMLQKRKPNFKGE